MPYTINLQGNRRKLIAVNFCNADIITSVASVVLAHPFSPAFVPYVYPR